MTGPLLAFESDAVWTNESIPSNDMEERPIENPSKLGDVDIIERLSALMTPRTEAITRSNFIVLVVWMMVGGYRRLEDYFMVEMAITSRAYETRWIIQRRHFLEFYLEKGTRD